MPSVIGARIVDPPPGASGGHSHGSAVAAGKRLRKAERISTLLDPIAYSLKQLGALYFQRWSMKRCSSSSPMTCFRNGHTGKNHERKSAGQTTIISCKKYANE
jgi:hypothetical protein